MKLIGFTEEPLSIITKLYEGNLYDLFIINNNVEFSSHLVGQFAFGISSAMAEMHYMNIVHRDLKSSNLLIERLADGNFNILLSDFGLCKVFDCLEVRGQKWSTMVGLSHRYAR